MGRVLTTDQQIEEALRNASDPEDCEIALSARFDRGNDLLILELKTGQRVAIPREDIQGLAGANPDDVAAVEILDSGTALHWEKLDTDFGVAGLAEGRYGSQKWMAGLEQRRRERLTRAS